MRKIILFLTLLLTLGFCISPEVASANNPQWVRTYSSTDESTEIRVAAADKSIVFASVRKHSGGLDLLKSSDHGTTWTSIRGTIIGNDANWIAIQHTNKEVVAVSVWGSGIYLTKNGGTTWTNIFPMTLPRSVAINPFVSDTIFAGIGGNNDSSSGIYRSIDGGASWTKAPLGNSNNAVLAIDPNNGNRIFGDLDIGLFRSTNGGNSWDDLVLSGGLSSFIYDISEPNTIYYTSPGGLAKSTDNGDSAVYKNNGFGSSFVFRVAQDDNGYLYASIRSPSGGVWRSKDRAETWENISDPSWGTRSVWGLDAKGGIIYAGVGGLGIYVADTNLPPPPPPTHKTCQNNACVTVDGTGENTCLTDTNCAPPPTHKACQNEACVVVDGAGDDSCQVDFDCIPPTHLACVNYACVVVDGLGPNDCKTDNDCIPPGPNPVVVIPGFGASWSYRALIEKDPTVTCADWELFPTLTDFYYQPLLAALRSAGLTDFGPNQNLFVFPYDYRKSIKNSASCLNDILDNQVLRKNPGKKADIAGHSMGGLVARYCFEAINGCAGKINKIVTGGSPHQGSLEAYDFWEAGKIHEKDLLLKTAEKLLLQIMGFPKINPKEIVQTYIPGAADLLPTFDYIFTKPYDSLISGKNLTLPIIGEPSNAFKNILTTLSGTAIETAKLFFVHQPSGHEQFLGWWVDGKPQRINKDLGDNTVLKTSSEVLGATNKYYNFTHADYFNNAASVADTLAAFGLTTTTTSNVTQPTSSLVVYSTPNVSIEILDKNNKRLGQKRDNGHSFFGQNLNRGDYRVEVTGQTDGNFEITVLYVDLKSDPKVQTFTGKIKKGQTQSFDLGVN